MGSATSTQAATSGHIAAFVISQGGAEYEAYRQCLIDSGITGAQLLAAKNSTELDKMLADINIENEEHRKFISKLLRKSALPPIRLIDFDSFVAHAEFPRFPDQENLVTTLDDIDRNNSLIVFVSHCWLRVNELLLLSSLHCLFDVPFCTCLQAILVLTATSSVHTQTTKVARSSNYV